MTQPELCFAPPPTTNHGRLEAAFLEFDRANPLVWQKFCQHCNDLLGAGFTRYSADAICHAIRFDHDLAIQSTGDQDIEGRRLRLNSNHVRFFSERWTREHPDHPGFFQSRKQHGQS